MVTTKHKPIVNTQKRKTKSSKYKVIEQEKKKGTTKIARKKKGSKHLPINNYLK